LCVAESTGEASVAIYNLDFVSNKNALGDWELITTYSAKYIQKLLKVGQRLDEFMEHLGEGFVKRMVINRGKVGIQLHLLIFWRHI
jgi:hypothetical protein